MGLDEIVADRDGQLVDQDSGTGEWGLADHIATSERGRIPEDTRELLKRAEDERVRQMRARGYDREEVAEIIGVTERTIRQKERRAKAYQFPLDVVAGSEARADYRDRGNDDSCHEEDTGGDSQGTDRADVPSARSECESETGASERDIATNDEATRLAEWGEMWPSIGSLARLPETDEYVFVLNVNRTHDQLQGVRTSRLSEEACAQIAAAGAPSQLEPLADAVRLVTEGPYCSGEAEAYEAVSLKSVLDPDLLMEGTMAQR